MTGIAQPAEANVDELDGAKGGSGTDGSMEFDPAVYRCVVFVPSQFPSVGAAVEHCEKSAGQGPSQGPACIMIQQGVYEMDTSLRIYSNLEIRAERRRSAHLKWNRLSGIIMGDEC